MNDLVQKFREGQKQSIEKRREKALRATELEFLPPLLEIQESPPSPWQHRVLWTLLALLLAGVLWSAFAQLPIVATAQGQFIPKGKVKVVQPLGNGTVKAILVHAGQAVTKGQALIELNPTVSAADAQATRGQLDLAHRQRQRIESQLGHPAQPSVAGGSAADAGVEASLQAAEEEAYRTDLAAAKSRLEQADAQFAAGRDSLSMLQQSLGVISSQLRDAEELASIGAIARDDYLRLKRQYIETRGQFDAQRHDMLKLQAEQDAARMGVVQVKARYRRDLLHSLESNTETRLRLDATNAKAQRDLDLQVLRSPVDGVVQEVGVTSVGEVVSPSQKVAIIVPRDTPLEVEANLPNQDIAFVKVGQPVQIKVAAFPFEQFGVIPGRVVQISPDATQVAAGSSGGPVPAGGLVYRIRVRPERSTLMAHGHPVPMLPGMAVQADIDTGRRSVMAFFLDPFKRNVSEGLSVR